MRQSWKRSLIARAPIFLGVAAILACGTDAAAPTASMAGTYSATQFRTTGSSGQTDQLGAGSTLSLILNANHTLSGHMHLAATSASPLFDADMAGTWAQTGSTVRFTSASDTFVNNMTFDIVPYGNSWQLVGTTTFSGTLIEITLSQINTV